MGSAELRKVIWLDSNSTDSWHDPGQTQYGPIRVTSIGWVMHETNESVSLAGSVVFGEDFQACGTMTIPKVCIVGDEKLAD